MNKREIKKIKMEEIFVDDEFNSRKRADESANAQLMESIKNTGLLNPITVSRNEINGFRYFLCAGFRRYYAMKNLQFNEIDACILETTDKKHRMLINIVENIQRTNLTKEQEGLYYSQLKNEFGMEYSEIGVFVSKPLSYVRTAINILAVIGKKYRVDIVSDLAKNTKNKKISATSAGLIASAGGSLNKEEREYLLETSKKDSFTSGDVQKSLGMIRKGINVYTAVENINASYHLEVKGLYFKDNKFKKDAKELKITQIQLLKDILSGKRCRIYEVL